MPGKRAVAATLIFCLSGCDDREFESGLESGADADASAPDAEGKFAPAKYVPPSRRQDEALDTVFVVDLVSYPEATVEDVAGETEWFNALMDVYFDLPVNYLHEALFAARNSAEDDSAFALRVLQENQIEFPEYLAIFSYGLDGLARCYGGYFPGVTLLPDYCNEFTSSYGNGLILGIIDLNHLFGRCGYDGETGRHVSNVSMGGECRGVDGVPCVWSGNYFVCEDLLEHPFVEDLDLFHGFVVAHEFLHAWGPNHEGCLEFGFEDCEVSPEAAEAAHQLNTCDCNVLRFLESEPNCEEGN
jgi:hypothetical protein